MFKGSGQINPQGLKNDYSGFERAAAIKQQTLAGVGRAIKEGHEKIVKKKKDAAALESSKVLMKKVADAAGFKIDEETLAAIAKGADPELMKTATETMAKLGEYSQKQEALMAQQKRQRDDQIEAARLVAQAKVDAAETLKKTNATTAKTLGETNATTAETLGETNATTAETLGETKASAAEILALARKPGEKRAETKFNNEETDRDALSDTVSMAAQRGWNLKTTMEDYHRKGGKDDMAVHDAWAKMNPNMKPEVATITDKDGKEHEVILWNGQMRSVADLTKTERTSAAAEAIEKSDLNPEQKTKLWTKIANLLGSNEDSDSIKALRIVMAGMAPFVGGGGSNAAPEVVNINDLP